MVREVMSLVNEFNQLIFNTGSGSGSHIRDFWTDKVNEMLSYLQGVHRYLLKDDR
ncbi:MAG: hypothetical protein ACE5OZ_08185 [Candidatus Heimdallarchaeota archaeon]